MAILLAMPGSESPVLTDFQTINTALSPRNLDVLNFYQGWPGNPIWWSSYPTWANELNALMMISWQPAAGSLYGGGGTSNGTLGNVTTGAADAYLSTSASTIAAYGKTVYIRLAPEFNGDWNPYGHTQETAAQFVAGWQYVVNKLRAGGATNAKFWWCANIWGLNSSTVTTDPTLADSSGVNWYPGDSYVDLVGLDGYMTNESPTIYTPSTLFLSDYQELTALTTRPFAIGEVGVSEASRLSSVGGKAGWYNLLFALIRNQMPNCVLVDYWDRVTGDDDYTISSSGTDTAAAAAFVQGVTSFPFVGTASANPGWTQPLYARLGGL
jgi:mannan endo-1,4-beta-mannosidase